MGWAGPYLARCPARYPGALVERPAPHRRHGGGDPGRRAGRDPRGRAGCVVMKRPSRWRRSFRRLDSEPELLDLGRAFARRALAELVARADTRDPSLEPAFVLLGGLDAAPVETLVARHERGEFGRQKLEVVVVNFDVDP